VWRNLRADKFRECLLQFSAESVFENTVSEYTELLLCPLTHRGTYILTITVTFISVYCSLHAMAFVENHHEGINT